jgi:hypothetical protein
LHLPAVRTTARVALEHDRAWVLGDAQGGTINGKRRPASHRLDARVSIEHGSGTGRVVVELPAGTDAAPAGRCMLDPDPASAADRLALESRLGAWFGEPVRFEHDAQGGFPDDPDSPGPTVVSVASLAAVASWFPDLDPRTIDRRFRSNLEFDECPAFWEDGLYGPGAAAVPFTIGGLELHGVNPCKRCVVPSREPVGGEPMDGFQRQFVECRRRSLPDWVDRSHFDTYYRLAVNTRPGPGHRPGTWLHVGDRVQRRPD